MVVDPASLLLTHAELALGLGGFASVVAALQRPLSPARRQRFLALISLALIQIIACVVPLWLSGVTPDAVRAWRWASALSILLIVFHLVWIWFLPIRRARVSGIVVNPTVNLLLSILFPVSLLALVLNIAGWPVEPDFSLYYGGLAGMLVTGFFLFVDVVVGTSTD